MSGTSISSDGVTPYLIVTRPAKKAVLGTNKKVTVMLMGGKHPTKYGIMRYVALVTPPKKDDKKNGIKEKNEEPRIGLGEDGKEFDWSWEQAYEGEAIFVDGQSFADSFWWKIQIPGPKSGPSEDRERYDNLLAKLSSYNLIRIDRCEVL